MAEHAEKDRKSRKAQCSRCGGERNCEISGQFQENGEVGEISWWSDWYILRCMGCDYIFVLKSTSDSESHIPTGYDHEGNLVYESDTVDRYWPALARRKRPEWFDILGERKLLSSDLSEVLDEAYTALDNDIRIVSAIAIRTAFDVAANILEVDDFSFKEKVKSLAAKGFIRTIDQEHLDSILEAGSASAHRGWKPSLEELDVMMDILERFVYDAFIEPSKREALNKRLERMRAGVPPHTNSRRRKGQNSKHNAAVHDAKPQLDSEKTKE